MNCLSLLNYRLNFFAVCLYVYLFWETSIQKRSKSIINFVLLVIEHDFLFLFSSLLRYFVSLLLSIKVFCQSGISGKQT